MELTGEDGWVYRLENAVGILDRRSRIRSVFEGLIRYHIPNAFENNDEVAVAMKAIRVQEGDHVVIAKTQIRRSLYFDSVQTLSQDLPDAIIRHKNAFTAYAEDNREYYCIVLPCYPEIISVRRILVEDFENGMPMNVLGFVALAVLRSLWGLHGAGETHLEFSAGTVFYQSEERVVKLGFGASLYQEVGDDVDLNQDNAFHLFRMVEWGRPPEVEEDELVDSEAVDIWLFGVMMLELAYGVIAVESRDQFLDVIANIRQNGLGNQWVDMLNPNNGGDDDDGGDEADVGDGGAVVRFPQNFENFVRLCFTEDPENRPTAAVLLQNNFLHEAPDHMDL